MDMRQRNNKTGIARCILKRNTEYEFYMDTIIEIIYVYTHTQRDSFAYTHAKHKKS